MSEPTAKEIMSAIVKLTSEVASLRRDQERTGRIVATDSFDLRGEISDFRAETKLALEELNEKIDTFQGVLKSTREDARDHEADVIAIHKGLVRAKVPGIPKDLPSQVRAKGERPSRPAARSKRRAR